MRAKEKLILTHTLTSFNKLQLILSKERDVTSIVLSGEYSSPCGKLHPLVPNIKS